MRAKRNSSPTSSTRPSQGIDYVNFTTLADLQNNYGPFEENGFAFPDHPWPVVRSPNLGHFELLESFPPNDYQTTPVPADILEVLGWDTEKAQLPGAYQTQAPL